MPCPTLKRTYVDLAVAPDNPKSDVRELLQQEDQEGGCLEVCVRSSSTPISSSLPPSTLRKWRQCPGLEDRKPRHESLILKTEGWSLSLGHITFTPNLPSLKTCYTPTTDPVPGGQWVRFFWGMGSPHDDQDPYAGILLIEYPADYMQRGPEVPTITSGLLIQSSGFSLLNSSK